MPLGGPLHDRARVISSVKSTTRTAGGYQKVEQTGPWFRCVYDPGTESESRGPGSVRRARTGASLTCRRWALDGSEIDIPASSSIEIDSQAQGQFIASIQGTPKRLGSRRLIGWEVSLTKVNREASG